MSSVPSDNLREIYSREIISLYYQIVNNSIAIDQAWSSILTDQERQRYDRERPALQVGEMSIVGAYSYLRQCSINTAIIEIARDLGLTSQINYSRLLREISEQPTPRVCPIERPTWHREVGELRWGDQVIRRVIRVTRSSRIAVVLDTFEEMNWPPRIDDPLSPPDALRLNETVRSLNHGLTIIRFTADGTGEGIRWIRI